MDKIRNTNHVEKLDKSQWQRFAKPPSIEFHMDDFQYEKDDISIYGIEDNTIHNKWYTFNNTELFGKIYWTQGIHDVFVMSNIKEFMILFGSIVSTIKILHQLWIDTKIKQDFMRIHFYRDNKQNVWIIILDKDNNQILAINNTKSQIPNINPNLLINDNLIEEIWIYLYPKYSIMMLPSERINIEQQLAIR